jgi:hypothetical protein
VFSVAGGKETRAVDLRVGEVDAALLGVVVGGELKVIGLVPASALRLHWLQLAGSRSRKRLLI